MTGASTKTDVAASEWAIDDSVVQLREWGTDAVRLLPQPTTSEWLPIHEWTIGAAATCALQLEDPTGRISRLHARLVREKSGWLLRDFGSKNGIRLDGASHSAKLHGFLARLLGWRAEYMKVIDHALRSIRMAATRRAALVLLGDGDLVPIARALHRRTLGADRPFIVCDPRRRRGRGNVRLAENYETGMLAFAAAAGGSMCLRSQRLPEDVGSVLAAFRTPASRVQVVVCGRPSEDCDPYLAAPITVPPFTRRANEIDRIITESSRDTERLASWPSRSRACPAQLEMTIRGDAPIGQPR